jgi:hypothetical protein
MAEQQPEGKVPETGFLKDPRKMPCFREAMLTGVITAFGLASIRKILLQSKL